MKSKISVLILFSAILFVIDSCKPDDPDPKPGPDAGHITTPYPLIQPSYFPQLEIPENNPTTLEGVELGRRLYYDPLLSANGPLHGSSCASCHLQEKSFSNNASGIAVIPHVNLAWKTGFLWHGDIEGTLEEIMLFEVRDFFQADMNLLKQHQPYPQLFQKAFGSEEITEQMAANAIAQFMRSVISANSKYDLFLQRKVPLTYSERQGMLIFESEKGDCFHCHTLPLTHTNSFHNTGLDSVFDSHNEGRFKVTGDSSDLGKFMTPGLRNIALTAPYMHDGRFKTLREVIEHYNSGVKHSDYLDPIMTKNGGKGLQLSASEIDHLLDFLQTLTDTSFLANPNFSSPF